MAEINETGEKLVKYLTEEDLAKFPPLDQDEGEEQVDGVPRHDRGYVYLIYEEGTNLFKVGLTSNLNRRLGELRCQYSPNLSYCQYVKVSDKQDAENAILDVMKRNYERADRGTEWFKISGNWESVVDLFLRTANKWRL